MPTISTINPRGSLIALYVIDAVLLPTVAEAVIDGDVDIISIVVSNEGGAASPKFTIKDKQATPRTFVFGVDTVVAAGTAVSFSKPEGMRASGGLTWVQDTAGQLVGRIEYRTATFS